MMKKLIDADGRMHIGDLAVMDEDGYVRMRAGCVSLDAEAIREFSTGKLAHYKIPRYVMVVDEFPMTVTGKIRKVEMRAVAARELGLE
jgi:fatty-acyl-CoA synthase